MARDLTLTEKLKKETVIGMLTRTAAHYPNSGNTIETLSVVAEDWYETFKIRLTDKAFIGAISQARRQSAFFPTEKNVFEAAGGSLVPECKKCDYFVRLSCGGGKIRCDAFIHAGGR